MSIKNSFFSSSERSVSDLDKEILYQSFAKNEDEYFINGCGVFKNNPEKRAFEYGFLIELFIKYNLSIKAKLLYDIGCQRKVWDVNPEILSCETTEKIKAYASIVTRVICSN